MKIWIDLDNSPHVPLFGPIIEELRRRGYDVVITARDAFQVKELAELHGVDCRLVGRHHGRHILWKLFGLGLRAFQLLPTAIRERPALSVSHGSRSQLVVSTLVGIPSVMICDYEFARTWALIRPTWVMVPEVIPSEAVHAAPDRVLHYPGIKEDVYVGRFEVDSTLRERLTVRHDEVLVTVRPPATEAHYHNPEGEELFCAAMDRLATAPGVRVVLLPRNDRQGEFVRRTWPGSLESGKFLLPSHVLEGLNLIWHSDLVISGGGTMNREAAALGVPVYSIFRGPLGAVDRFLASEGRLVVVSDVREVSSKICLVPRNREVGRRMEAGTALGAIVEQIVRIVGMSDAQLAPTKGE